MGKNYGPGWPDAQAERCEVLLDGKLRAVVSKSDSFDVLDRRRVFRNSLELPMKRRAASPEDAQVSATAITHTTVLHRVLDCR